MGMNVNVLLENAEKIMAQGTDDYTKKTYLCTTT